MQAPRFCDGARSRSGLALAAVVALACADGLASPPVDSNPLRSGALAQTQQTAPELTTTSSRAAIELARHLTRQGAVLYVAYWCPHCFEQKQMFGRAASSELTIVECATDGLNNRAALCRQKKLVGYPSWEMNGKVDVGVKSLRQLAELSRFPNPDAF